MLIWKYFVAFLFLKMSKQENPTSTEKNHTINVLSNVSQPSPSHLPPTTTTTTLVNTLGKEKPHHNHQHHPHHKKIHPPSTDNSKKDEYTDGDDEEEYYDKSEDYQDGEYDESADDLGTAFNTFGKKFADSDFGDSTLPIFIEEPQNTYVMRTKTAALTCKAVHALELSFHCSGNIQPIITNRDSHVDPHKGIRFLEITTEITRNLVEEYFGKEPFQCECHAISARGDIKSQPAVIEIAYIKKHFNEHPTSLQLEMGSKAEMHCSPPLANPTPNVTWFKNGLTLVSRESVIILEDNTLAFQHVTITDMGNYSCIAENIAGRRISDPVTVTVFSNGGWTQWSTWQDCKCNGVKSNGRKRSRTCTNPAPLNGGQPCSGLGVQRSPDCVTCQPGRWSNWSDWSTCNYDCAQTRRRTCLSLESHYGLDEDISISDRISCVGRDFQTTDCRSGACRLDRDETDWPMYAGLALIIVVCITLGGILSYVINRRRQSPYSLARTAVLNPNKMNGKPMGYDVIPVQTMVSTSNFSYPFTRNNTKKCGFTYNERPNSEHLYDEPHLRANFTYPSPTHHHPPNDKVSINGSLTSSHYSRGYYSSES